MNDIQTVEKIVSLLGGRENVISLMNCMTRLRVEVKSEAAVKENELKNLEKVLGLIHDGTGSYEVVVGPGNSKRYADIYHEMAGSQTDNEVPDGKNRSDGKIRIKDFIKIISEIFIPMLPGVIAAGLCAGFTSLIAQIVPDMDQHKYLNILCTFLTLINKSFMAYVTAWVGYNAAKRFKATPITGAMLGMITTLEGINTISQTLGLYNDTVPLDSVLMTGKGGVMAVICSVYFLSVFEKKIRKIIPPSLDIILTPLVSLSLGAALHIFVLMPLFGFLSNGIVWLFGGVCMSESIVVRILTGYFASALFLPLVATGMHHGLVALYTVQLQELGYVTLYPALAMAGAGQVGAALAIYVKAKKLKHEKLCSVIKGAFPAGILGIGEPLIYGVTLPMGHPFITAGLGAGFGGALVMALKVAATMWGPSGIVGTLLMSAGPNGMRGMAVYAAGLIISYTMAFIITSTFINKNMVREALGGIQALETVEDKNEVRSQEGAHDKKEVRAQGSTLHKTVRHGEVISFGDPVNTFEYTITDELGIHARPAGGLAAIAKKYEGKITFKCKDKAASGKSVLELMSLGAEKGSKLTVIIEGMKSDEAATALKSFLEENL